jgi:hypothetical protein
MLLISSFYNEEYLLPWWCEHHKWIKRAVLFDYFSTDRSAEIIKSICPDWEIRPTRNKDWNFADNDAEYMDAEKEIDGYKIVLATTEFLIGEFNGLPKEKSCFAIPMARMVDNEPDKKPVYGKPLVEQKKLGFRDKSANKYRFLHNYETGEYTVGRHSTPHGITGVRGEIYKYVFSPWTKEFIKRKLAMKSHLSPKDINLGKHHKWDKKKLFKEYNYAVERFDTSPKRNIFKTNH